MSSRGHIFYLGLLLASLPCFAKTVVTYPQQMCSDGYPIALLKLALDKSELRESYVLEEASVDVQQGRSLLLLRKQIEIDVAWSMSSNEREKGLRAQSKYPFIRDFTVTGCSSFTNMNKAHSRQTYLLPNCKKKEFPSKATIGRTPKD